MKKKKTPSKISYNFTLPNKFKLFKQKYSIKNNKQRD
jgi:hypothetical protein